MTTGNTYAVIFSWPLTPETSEECLMALRELLGQPSRRSPPLKSKSGDTITDQGKQMDRWVEHYRELYSRENVVTETILNAAQSLPVMDELDVQPSKSELSDAIDPLANGKAPGKDGITPEIIKSAKTAILSALYKLLCLCWDEGAVPHDMRDANIINLSAETFPIAILCIPLGVKLLALIVMWIILLRDKSRSRTDPSQEAEKLNVQTAI
ncbi:uncharacterized protein [Heterodontus francisci]|uniref:uncharacterized protein isoform X1 n=1 Tax=Heterodontus francisci TaxID=7792 RepID=UPI00355AFA1B